MRKRAFDLGVALIAGVVTAPLSIAIAIAIGVIEGRPVLHRATRVGKDGRRFTMFKFRTMGPRDGPLVTVAGDARITTVGSLLRMTKLDELPQLWNVVRGDMSLVGPRPEDPEYVEHYTAEQRRVLSVAPGITSWASVAYRDEERLLAAADDPEQSYLDVVLPAKVALDLEWLDRRSLREDIRVLRATARALFSRR